MKNKGFTLIELLAVIIILGILMLIAIPSVTSYINNSRKETYVDTVKEILNGASILVNSGEIEVNDPDTTYYVDIGLIPTENGAKRSPYDEFDEAYVVVTYDGENYDYYFVGNDKADLGVYPPEKEDVLSKDSIKNVDDIDTGVAIGNRNKRVIIDKDKNTTDGTVTSRSNLPLVCKKATTLHETTCLNPYGDTPLLKGCLNTYEYGEKIIFGNIPSGEPKSGDAYDCDVNNDGIYDPETERFYYVSKFYNSKTRKFENDKSVLNYYTNIDINMNPTKRLTNKFSTGSNSPEPSELLKYLPTVNEWTNPGIIPPGTRYITDYYFELKYDFSYGDAAARPLVYKEIIASCDFIYNSLDYGELKKCPFLLENIDSYYGSSRYYGYWIETNADSTFAFSVTGGRLCIGNNPTSSSDIFGTRPAITVYNESIEK